MALKGAPGLHSRCFPSRAYLIETSRGSYLWDTGLFQPFSGDAARGICRLYPIVTHKVHLQEKRVCFAACAETAVHQLRDIAGIVVSHFHADHVAGLRDFPDVRVLCAAEGWQSIQGLSGLRALRKAFLPGLIPPDISARIDFVHDLEKRKLPPELLPFREGWDLTGGGEVYLVPLPGHAVGHIGAFVRDGDKWLLLASDAAWATSYRGTARARGNRLHRSG